MDEWLRIRGIIEDALELPPKDRLDFIAAACSGNLALQHEVEQYLVHENSAETPLSIEHLVLDESEPEVQPDPERLGVFKILRRLGEGGMGIVYLAERDRDEFHQQVALKVLKPSLQSGRLLRLFQRERQILAQLQHPNIAYLVDGGTVNERIYYAMEFVEGSPVTTFSKERELSTVQRLRLFCRICDAVSYAHRKLVIHRDLKPSNILVTADGAPKLLDFGLAKLFGEELGAGSMTVSIGGMMTPAYASPEQVRGEHLSTAADIYSLGLLLYELLTGQNPQAGENKSPFEVCRTILEDDPRPPSQTPGSGEHSQLRGDLDNIVLKCLRKEPEQRYGSVDSLREDIEHYLDGFPVGASRGTAWYRGRKYLRRHRWGLSVSCLSAALLLGAAGSVWWQGRQAERRFEDVRGLAHSVIFELHDAVKDLPGSTGARKLIVERALQYLHQLEGAGTKKRSLQLEIAAAYQKIGEVQSDNVTGTVGDTSGAINSFLQARRILNELSRSARDDDQAEMMLRRVDAELANVYEQQGDELSRAKLSREAIELQWKIASRHPDALDLKADALRLTARDRGKVADWKAASPLWSQAIALYQQALLKAPANAELIDRLAETHSGLAQVCSELNQLPCATEHYSSALQLESTRLATRPSDTRLAILVSYNLIDLAWVEQRSGKAGDAVAHGKRALSLQEQIASADPDNIMVRLETAKTLLTNGLIYRNAGQLGNAAASLQESVSRSESLLARDGKNQSTLFHLAWANAELGDVYFRRAQHSQGTGSRTRTDLINATRAYEHAAKWLERLRLGGKLDGLLDDTDLRASVLIRRTECRKHLQRLQVTSLQSH